jgi:hypothetical protein
MSKFGHYQEYPERGLAKAKAALLTVWPSLSRYHDDLVLVGGLAVDCLTKAQPGGYPVAVTIDADLGISLGAGGDMYGTISTDLAGLGFDRDTVNTSRYFRDVEGVKIYLDFLTESPDAQTGSQRVDDIIASVIPGINRALASRRGIPISGPDLYGAEQTITVNVAGIGPLIALKVNAFGGPTGRRHPKDAYDLLLLVTSYIDGSGRAISGFHDEAGKSNPAYGSAIEALRKDFYTETADGPVRAAEFLRGTLDEAERIRQDMVTVARRLLGEDI